MPLVMFILCTHSLSVSMNCFDVASFPASLKETFHYVSTRPEW